MTIIIFTEEEDDPLTEDLTYKGHQVFTTGEISEFLVLAEQHPTAEVIIACDLDQATKDAIKRVTANRKSSASFEEILGFAKPGEGSIQ